MFPVFHLPKLDFRHSFYPQASVFYIPNWLRSFFVLAGNERALVEVAGGLPDWLEFFRGKSWVVLRLGLWVWNSRWHRPCRLQLKMRTMKILLLKQAQSVLIWFVLREAFPRNSQGIFCRCLCTCFWVHWSFLLLSLGTIWHWIVYS